jgi:hypothetical protein
MPMFGSAGHAVTMLAIASTGVSPSACISLRIAEDLFVAARKRDMADALRRGGSAAVVKARSGIATMIEGRLAAGWSGPGGTRGGLLARY